MTHAGWNWWWSSPARRAETLPGAIETWAMDVSLDDNLDRYAIDLER